MLKMRMTANERQLSFAVKFYFDFQTNIRKKGDKPPFGQKVAYADSDRRI
jgi:hypothetical protein